VTDAGLRPNPSYTAPAEFTSGGPRSGDAAQKPDVIAPGVEILSAASATGTEGTNYSGTSMAAPHAAGIAALVLQEHPKWSADMVKAAIVGTADGSRVAGFDTRIAGNGLVDAADAVATDTVLVTRHGQVAVNFGFHELDGAYSDTQTVTLRNTGSAPATYQFAPLWNSDPLGAAVTVSPARVTVAPHSDESINVTMRISRHAVEALPDADQGSDSVITLRGQIVATPLTDDRPLSIAFMMAPHGRSDVRVTNSRLKFGANGHRFGAITLRNSGVHSGIADVYNWLLSDTPNPHLAADSRALGVQYFPGADPDFPNDTLMVFAFAEFGRFSSPTQNYYHLSIDTDQNGRADHEIYVIDHGVFEDNYPDGIMNTYVLDDNFNGFVYDADVPTDGTIALGFAFASDLGMTRRSGPADVLGESYSTITGSVDPYDGVATINPYHPQASSGDYITMPPNSTAKFTIDERMPRRDEIPAEGWMIVTFDDKSGVAQADLVRG
jgi:hypothetical protein